MRVLLIPATWHQTKLDHTKRQYASMLQDMQDLQAKLTEGQQKLKALSEDYMKIVKPGTAAG